jgi:hypothetical protein
MNISREIIESELKGKVIPLLRAHGFKGSFPNFYREVNNFVSLVNFQFFSSGGSFCINLSYADPSRNNIYARKDADPKKLKVSQARERVRLGAEKLNGDHWFSFGTTSYGEYRGEPLSIDALVSKIVTLFETDAETWWSTKCNIGS